MIVQLALAGVGQHQIRQIVGVDIHRVARKQSCLKNRGSKPMRKHQDTVIEQKLDSVIDLLKHLVALELAKEGLSKQAIAKQISVAKATVVKMTRGVKRNG